MSKKEVRSLDEVEQDIMDQSIPDSVKKIEWMKTRLGLETNEQLISKALTLLHMSIELEDQGYTVAAYTKPDFMTELVEGRHVIELGILPKNP
ncbi:hypothetical protein [Paenibacillus sp. Soil787]|uniref:hypothetical protein n=1 Tax=Paenibacillus sp. Soil787 TaxID=1736411 RepID=UPI0006FA0A73|nr:hypothetical protein [Paenibacillus sp. Soil787]KRF31670.1 hypothetical protein ASG93_04850 [Paenibacillus sp. Soil787]